MFNNGGSRFRAFQTSCHGAQSSRRTAGHDTVGDKLFSQHGNLPVHLSQSKLIHYKNIKRGQILQTRPYRSDMVGEMIPCLETKAVLT